MNTEKRITYKRKRPNPIFQEWLEDLHEEAKEKQSKLEPMLKEALTSLSKYPLPLQSGAECAILKGFDKRLCVFLDRRLEVVHSNQLTESEPCSKSSNVKECNLKKINNTNSETFSHNIKNPLEIESIQSNINSGSSSTKSTSSTIASLKSKIAKDKSYKPGYRTGGYAILVALLENVKENPDEIYLSKENLIERAQKHSEESFVRPRPNTFYTAWSSMSKLVSKGLVVKCHKKKVYSLSDEGISLANSLLDEYSNKSTINDIIFDEALTVVNTKQNSIPKDLEQPTSCPLLTPRLIELNAGEFDIVLLIDKNETGGVTKKNDPTVAQFNKYPDLKHEYRSLNVGDFTWVARYKDKKDQELVLPYVVERKRMDDLGASIKDGRFHEQKFRLKKCGLKNVIYMVENYGKNKHVGLPLQSLMQALANTRVQDGFRVHFTDSLTHTARFLAMLTKRLTIEYKDKILFGCDSENGDTDKLMTFEYFNKSSSKNKALTVTETFIKLLLQLKGVSVEKALAITNTYATPKSLIDMYKRSSEEEGQLLLANLKFGEHGRNIGPNLSKSIYHLFNT